MKNCFKYLALLVASLCIAPPSQAATSFSLELAGEPIQPGRFFDVNVIVHDLFADAAGDELLAFGFNLSGAGFDLIEFVGSSSKAPFSDDALMLELSAAGLAFPGVTNNITTRQSVTLATLHFQALAAGQISLVVASDLTDFNQGLFFLNQGQIAISASRSFTIAPVPLPPSALVFVSGLLISLSLQLKRNH